MALLGRGALHLHDVSDGQHIAHQPMPHPGALRQPRAALAQHDALAAVDDEPAVEQHVESDGQQRANDGRRAAQVVQGVEREDHGEGGEQGGGDVPGQSCLSNHARRQLSRSVDCMPLHRFAQP
eukprot:CAMPEP_0203847160 /NCGR_PEP_ID=MMETSP0359-20131031/4849_1 /ASSEMBLY_ACC=CAM_ASM_000338 /TAXON_ID=268821 /ORGANISM="Scrippsiella Hangoei, Strain SHTV-5" /LENGTH=123 /DNA_ID=CAMNT_0050762581 /DNA_START=527 /DNA_END=898 /DNA_ORIENTATION=+